ncbi:MAG: MraY family glycosyltransferase [Patescibacteria group bacterium]
MEAAVVTFLVALAAALVLTPLLRIAARALGILDAPTLPRKQHARPTPLLGGVAVWVAFVTAIAAGLVFYPTVFEALSTRLLVGLLIASGLLMIGGYFDDRYSLPPHIQILFPSAAAVIMVIVGVRIDTVTNPLGTGVIELPTLISLPVTWLWFMVLMYTTKLLDGLDGLATGISAIGSLMIVALTATALFWQPDIGALAAAVAGACIGFLVYNFHRASIFLGEGGSVLLGFLLGTCAIVSGSKIATTLLVLGVPVADMIRVAVMRFVRRAPITSGDSTHLHHLLLRAGFSHRATVLMLYAFAITFGVTTLVASPWQKAITILAIVLLTWGIAAVILWDSSDATRTNKSNRPTKK